MNRPILIILVITIVILVGGIFFVSNISPARSGLHGGSVQNQNSRSQTILPEKTYEFRDFTLAKYDDSGDINLATINKEKPTIVQFWATWCEICRAEFPETNKIIQKYKDRVDYIAVDWAQGDRNAVKKYIEDLGLDPTAITFVMDPDGAVGSQYGVRGTPQHIFIKKGGEVIFDQPGGLSPQGFEALIKEILES